MGGEPRGKGTENNVRYDPLTFSVACHVGPDAFGMGISKLAAGQNTERGERA